MKRLIAFLFGRKLCPDCKTIMDKRFCPAYGEEMSYHYCPSCDKFPVMELENTSTE